MIEWHSPWRQFNPQEHKESYFLGELSWELEPFPDHVLRGKELTILGWIPGYDHFIVKVSGTDERYYVNLNWNKGGQRTPPAFQPLTDDEELNRLLKKVGRDNRQAGPHSSA